MLILNGDDNSFLTIRLEDIILHIDDIGDYKWNLLWIEGVAVRNFNMLDFEKKVNESPNGYKISSLDLIELSNNFIQLIEIILIGDRDTNNLDKLDNDDDMKSKCEFFIELVDSSYWEISSKNELFIKKIKENFAFEEF